MLRQAVFLVGGLGTRLGHHTQKKPKPLLTVCGRPFIDYLIDEAARHGFTDIILLAGHFGDQFDAYNNARRRNACVRVIKEPAPLGTGGAVKHALDLLDDVFLLWNGDTFFDINIRALAVPRAGEVSMALVSDAEGDRYARVSVQDGHVRAFHAPGAHEIGPINAGIYLMSKLVVAAFREGVCSIEHDYFPLLASQGRIIANSFKRFFIDMGVPADLTRANAEITARTRRPAVFLDRDGVLNVDRGHVYKRDQFDWIDGAKEAIRACNDRGYFVFVVTNQAGVARGYFEESDIIVLHRWIGEQLAEYGAHVDAFEYCPHHPEAKIASYRSECRRRKPESGMILDLMVKWSVDRERSFLIGDKASDLAAASGAGIPGYQFSGVNLRVLVQEQLAARGS